MSLPAATLPNRNNLVLVPDHLALAVDFVYDMSLVLARTLALALLAPAPVGAGCGASARIIPMAPAPPNPGMLNLTLVIQDRLNTMFVVPPQAPHACVSQ